MLDPLIVLIAKYLIFVSALVAAVFWLYLPKEEKVRFVLRFLAAGILAVAISKLIAHFYFDPRPFAVRHVAPLFSHAPDNGFPSDHTTLTMLAALLVWQYSKKAGTVLAAFSLLIGIARVLSLVHSPVDIAGSVAIAAVSVLAGTWLVRLYRRS